MLENYEFINDVFDESLGGLSIPAAKIFRDFKKSLPELNTTYPVESMAPTEDEGEFLTLAYRPHRTLQPRSGPLYKEDYLERGRHSSFGSLYRQQENDRARPSFFQKHIQNDLKIGRIPAALHESYRLIDMDDPVAVDFQERMTTIANRILGGIHGPGTRRFRFALSDVDDMAAFIMSIAIPPIVVVSKSIIEKFETEDELAALLAHELTHQKIVDRIGIHESSNPEESGADAWAVNLLQDAGYNPSAMLTMLEKIHPDSFSRRRKSAIEASEPHPPYAVRLRHVEDVLGYLESRKKLNEGETPLDPELKRAVAPVRHIAFVPSFLDRSGYEAKSPEEKVGILCKLWDQYLVEFSFDERKTCFDDFENEVSALAALSKETPRILDPLLKRALSAAMIFTGEGDYKNDRIESLYKALSKGYGNFYQGGEFGFTPVGPLEDLKTAMTCFIAAETAEDAQAHAEVINAIAPLVAGTTSTVMQGIRWPDFEIPGLRKLDKQITAGETCALPWNRHLLWSQESPEIKLALGRFNINDAGVPDIEDDLKIIFRPIDWELYGYQPIKNLTFDAEGHIAGHNIKRVKREVPKIVRFSNVFDSDKGFLDARDKEADELLKTAEWADLESGFWDFVKKYKDQLTPQITTSEGGDKFQKAFCDKCRELLAKDPEKFRPVLERFFQTGSPRGRTEDDENEKFTFSAMKVDFEKEFHVHPQAKVIQHRSFKDGGSYALQYGLSVETPYLSLALHDLDLPLQDRFRILDASRWRRSKGQEPEDFVAFDFRTALKYSKPQSAQDLYDVITYLNTAFDNPDRYGEIRPDLYKAIVNAEIYAYLKLEKKEALDIGRLSRLCGKDTGDVKSFFSDDFVLSFYSTSMTGDDTKKAHQNSYARLLDRQIEWMFSDDSYETKSAADMIDYYRVFCFGNSQRTSFFDRRPKERAEYENRIREKISATEDSLAKTKVLRTLLCECDLKNPGFRSWAVKEWTVAQGLVLKTPRTGVSDSEKYLNIVSVAEDIVKNARMGQSVEMLNGLLEEIQAQEDDSFMVRDRLVNHFLRSGVKGNLVAAANDYVLERIGDEPAIRENLLEFLTSPLTAETTDAFMKSIKDADLGYRYGHDVFYIFKNQRDEMNVDIPEETRVQTLHNIYRNFWALPFAARALYIERVLFPIGEEEQGQFQKAVSYAMDKIMPTGRPYADQARLVLGTHMEQCSKPLQRLVFSALVTASEKQEGPETILRPGEILSQVLGKSGAAGGKILQAMHSYLQSIPDPDENLMQLRDDLKSSKSNYNKPFRWDMLHRVKECYAPPTGQDRPEVGRQLGSGSYGYTVELLAQGRSTALTLAREGVAEESHYQFGVFGKTAEKLARIDKMWKPLTGILANAREMSAVESDFEIAAKQIKVAETLYNGLSVCVDGHTFKISTASLLNHGKEFKETVLAPGQHFIDLPAATEDQRKYRRSAAKAVLAAEIHIWMRGGAFDYDRHGAQCRIAGEAITMFDHGSIPYDIKKKRIIIPSKKSKIALGRIISGAYREALDSGAPVTDVLITRLTRVETQDNDLRNYLECFKRGMLALGDYIQDIGDTPEEKNSFIKEAILQSVKTGLADESIMAGLLHSMNLEDLPANAPGKSGFSLRDSRSNMPRRIVSWLSLAFSRTSLGNRWRNATEQGCALSLTPENKTAVRQSHAP